jgi:hypothetical protein
MREVPFADPDVDDIPAFLRSPAPPPPQPVELPVSLPPSGTGVRARRRHQRRRYEWQRRGGGALLAALLVALLVVIVARPWHHTGAGPTAPRSSAAPTRLGALPASAVLVQPDAQGAARSITLLVASPSGRGGRIVFIPPATMTEVPSFGLDALGRGLSLGGPSLFQVTLENLLGVALPPATVVNDAQLAALVQPAAPLNVDVPGRVEQTGTRGSISVLWEQGPAGLGAADVPRFLSAPGEGNDLARLARHQTFWTSWLATIGHDPAKVGPAPPDLANVLRVLAGGSVSYDTLPVEAVDAGTGGDEVYRVRPSELDQLLGQLLPGNRAGPRIRVQVLNGTGAIGVALKAAQHLVPAGAQVTLSGNADSFAYAQTQIVFYDRSRQQLATQVRQALGTGRLVLSRQPLDVVDVTVVIGKDFNG